jgi:hypothetical protein
MAQEIEQITTAPENPENPETMASHRFIRRPLMIAAFFFAATALGLSVGLGVGLTRRGDDAGSDKGGIAGPTAVWQPAVNTSWQIVLLHPIKIDKNAPSIVPDVDVYDFDLYDNTKNGTDSSTIDALHKLGKKVICYFSAGSYEPNRIDSGKFAKSDLGSDVKGWPGEKWLDLRSTNVANIMKARIQAAAKMGCDAIDPDNMDAYVSSRRGRLAALLAVPDSQQARQPEPVD